MKTHNISLGKFGEDYTAEFLEKNGYEILDRNYRNGYGEIDIIAKKDEYIVFIEVKTRTSLDFGCPSEAVGYTKQKKIRNLASFYLQGFPGLSARFDIAEVLINRKAPELNYIENAFI